MTKIKNLFLLVSIIYTQTVLASSLDLTPKINNYIKAKRKQSKVSNDERTSWYAYDLVSKQVILSINARRQMQAASMIKPFIALAFFDKVKNGKIKYGAKSKAQLQASIQHSDNKATNWLMRNVGGPKAVQKILSKNYPDIFKETKVVEYIPAGGKTYKNCASALDYGRFLKALWKRKLPYSKEILWAMSLPGRDRLYSSTPIPKGTLVYNKTGSTARLCGDMGILVACDKNGKKHPYIIVGIIEKSKRTPSYGNWMRMRGNIIRAVSTQTYNALKIKYNLR